MQNIYKCQSYPKDISRPGMRGVCETTCQRCIFVTFNTSLSVADLYRPLLSSFALSLLRNTSKKRKFQKHRFSFTWRMYVTHGRIHVIVHVACLNVGLIPNINPSGGNIELVVFPVGNLLQIALVTTSPSLPKTEKANECCILYRLLSTS